MRMTKILAMLVATAMTIAVVPGLAIAVNASGGGEDESFNTDIISNAYAVEENRVFDGSYKGNPLSSNGKIGKIDGAGGAWEGWSGTYSTNNRDFSAPSNDNFCGLQTYHDTTTVMGVTKDRNYLKFQRSGLDGGDGKNKQYAKVTAPTDVTSATDKDVIIIEYTLKHNGGQPLNGSGTMKCYGLFSFIGNDDAPFAEVWMDWENSHRSSDIRYDNGKMVAREKDGLFRITVVNDKEANTHDLYFETAIDQYGYRIVKYTKDINGTVDGFKGINVEREEYNTKDSLLAIGDLTLYASDLKKADITVKYEGPDNTDLGSKEIKNALVGSVIDLTDPSVIVKGETTYVKSVDSDTSYIVKEGTNEITVKYDIDTIASVTPPEDMTIIYGNTPVLPDTVTATLANSERSVPAKVTWNWDEAAPTSNPSEKQDVTVNGTVEGYDKGVTFTATVLPVTFELNDMGKESTQNFPLAITDEFTIEFDYTSENDRNNWIYISHGGALWGNGQIGIGTNNDSTGKLYAKAGSSGSDKSSTETVKLGNTYRVIVTGNASIGTYDVTVRDPYQKTILTADDQPFRKTNADIDSIHISSENRGAEFKLSNIKVYAENIKERTVNIKFAEAQVGTYKTGLCYAPFTVPKGIYAKQYHLDADVKDVNDGGDVEATGKLNMFTWATTNENGDKRVDAAQFISNNNTYNSATVVSWGDKRTGYIYATFPKKEANQQYVIKLTGLYTEGTANSNTPSIDVSAITDSDKVKAFKEIDLAGGQDTSTALENAFVDATEVVTNYILADDSGASYDKNDNRAKQDATTRIIVPKDVNISQGEAVLKLVPSARGIFAAKKVEITAVDTPAAPEVSLGWNDESGFAILVDSNAPSVDIIPEKGGTKTEKTDDNGIALIPKDTNVIYTFKGNNEGVTGEASEPVSVYSLVMAALKELSPNEGDTIVAEQISKVNDVINAGGLYINEDALPAEANGVLTYDAAQNTVTIEEKLFKAGLKFVGIKYSLDGDEKTAQISENGQIATLTETAEGMETAIYLEDIEFTFESDATEYAADETVSGELDFVEEV